MSKKLLIALIMVAASAAQGASGVYTTHTNTTTTTTTRDANGNVTGSNTVTTQSSTEHPLLTTHNPGQRAVDKTAAQFPYDSTNGTNRSDVDTPRRGFDDPRDPWDGRYSNDNPSNYSAGKDHGATDPSRQAPDTTNSPHYHVRGVH